MIFKIHSVNVFKNVIILTTVYLHGNFGAGEYNNEYLQSDLPKKIIDEVTNK